MPVVTRKMTDLKEGILAKIDEKFNELKNDFLTEIKKQIKNEVTAAIKLLIPKLILLWLTLTVGLKLFSPMEVIFLKVLLI